jgi:hypothetical protein
MVIYNTGSVASKDAVSFFSKLYLAIMEAEQQKQVKQDRAVMQLHSLSI